MCNFLDPHKYVRALPNPLWISHSPVFPFKLLTSPLCATVIHYLRQPQLEQLPLNAFDNYPQGKRLSPWLSCKSSQIKRALQVSSSREPPDRTNNDNSLRMGLWRSSNPILLPLVAARPRVFTIIVGCLFSRLLQSWGGEMGIRQIKMPQSFLFLLRFRCFSWINAPQIAAFG